MLRQGSKMRLPGPQQRRAILKPSQGRRSGPRWTDAVPMRDTPSTLQRSSASLTACPVDPLTLGAGSLQEAQDIVISLLLSELVYKAQDGLSKAECQRKMTALAAEFPPGLVAPVAALAWSPPDAQHSFLVAETRHAVYLACVGTKQRRDLLANLAVCQELLWPEWGDPAAQEPAAHSGFLSRARSIPTAALHARACQHGKRLVVTGHSLGAAVAQLCALDLLQLARSAAGLTCISFAAPVVGNPALAAHVQRRGWDSRITNYLLPEDTIGCLFGRLLATEVPAPAADTVLSNIVPRRPNRPQARPKGGSFASLARSAVRTAALVLTLPLWAHRSYAVVGRTAFLNPLGVGPQPLDWSPVLTEEAADLCSSRFRMLRMHRLPVYRSRVRSLVCGKCNDVGHLRRPGGKALAAVA